MNLFGKLKKSWWIIFSFIPYLNGFGFIFLGAKTRNINWVIEGIIYEIPTLFILINLSNEPTVSIMAIVAFFIWFVAIIRSFWVAISFFRAYD